MAMRRGGKFQVVVLLASWTFAGLARSDDALLNQLPAGALASLELRNLGSAITRLQKSELVRIASESPPWQAYLKSADYQRVDAGRKLIEAQLGMDAFDALKQLLGHQIAVAFYPKPAGKNQDLVAMIRVAERPLFDKARQTLDFFVRFLGPSVVDGSSRIGNITVWTVQGKFFFASDGDWLVAASSKRLAEAGVRSLQSIAPSKAIGPSPAGPEPTPLLSARVDLKQASKLSGKPSEPTRFDNFVGAWLFGGVAELARVAPAANLTARLGERGIEFSVDLPVDWQKLPPSARGFFISPTDRSTGASVDALPSAIACLSLERDFVHLYKAREGNMQAHVLPEFDKFETGLANLMPGRNFVEDVLPLIGKRLTIYVGNQRYDHLGGEPAIKIPGFAFVLETGESENAADLFQLVFQSVVAILNFQVGERGGEPMIVRGDVHRGVLISYGKHMRGSAKGPLPMAFNFTPASARVGKRLVLSSSFDFCKQLVDRFGNGNVETAPVAGRNASFVAAADTLAILWNANRSFLESKIAQSGKDAAQSKRDFDAVSRLLGSLDRLRVDGQVKATSYELRIGLTWK